MRKIPRPIVLAICGKSAAGKDTLAQFLTNYLLNKGVPAHNIVSITTRPRRVKESDGKDYYFTTKVNFQNLINENALVEFTTFRGWYYGIPKHEIRSDKINVGVFNPEGLQNLFRQKYKYNIIPIYLEEPLGIRMRRSVDREGRFKFEFIRRAFVDWVDFKGIKKILGSLNNGHYIHLYASNGTWKQAIAIETMLIRWGILDVEDGKQVRLGNFV